MEVFSGTILDFDLNKFTRKDIVPPKTNTLWQVPFLAKAFQDKEVKFDMTTKYKVVFECLQETHAPDQHMPPVEYRTILGYRHIIPLFPIDEVCPVYYKAYLNTFGNIQFIVGSSQTSNIDMNLLGMSLFMYLGAVEVYVKKDPYANLMTGPHEQR